MTQKDYYRIAKIISILDGEETRHIVGNHFSIYFSADPKFDLPKFVEALQPAPRDAFDTMSKNKALDS